jgi:hypothetical protein
MAGKPQVTLTLAGDASQLEKAFDSVGQSSRKLSDDVGASSQRIADDTESGFGRAGEAADGAEGKAQGFADVLTGTADIGAGTAEIMKGNLFEGFVTVGQGAADLAGGLASFLIPALGNLNKATISSAASTVRQTAANVAARGAALATAAAQKVLTAGQWALNVAMRANPIGLIITALTLLVGGLIYAYNKSETFRKVVNGALGAVKNVAVSVFNWIRDNWRNILGILLAPFSLVIKPIWKHRDSILNAIKAVPGAIGRFMSGVANIITAPFRAAFNGVRNAWNSTVGGKGFTVPGWIPQVGGKSFSIPYFHTGGVVSGAMGSETLAVLKAGERVTGGRGSSGGPVIVLRSDGGRVGKLLIQILREAIRIEGGDVQVVLGR